MRPIKTIAQLQAEILADMQNAFGVTIFSFGKVFLRALAAMLAAILYLYYLQLGLVQKNIFVDTADSEAIGGNLESWGRVKLNRNPFAARAGEYTATVTGTAASVIAINTTFKSNDNSAAPGFLFVLDAAYTLPSGTGSITIRSFTAGLAAKLAIGNTLTATSPISGVSATITITAITVEPAAAEDLERYRQRIIDAFRTETQGGAGGDYRIWSADAQGVQQVYPYAKSGQSAEIELYVEATIADSTDGKGTPSALLLAAVEAVVEFDPDTTRPLNERGRRPLGVFDIDFLPIVPLDVTVVVNNYIGLTPAIRTAIENSIATSVNAVRPFVSSADVLADKRDIVDNNSIVAAIFNAKPGSQFGAVQLYVDGFLVPSYTFINGNIPFYVSTTFL